MARIVDNPGVNDALLWDIFCQVIDNHGDLGVCWRLSVGLAARAQRVRLWVDDASALRWMAPAGCAGVEVLNWNARTRSLLGSLPRSDVVVEAFGCQLGDDLLAFLTTPGAPGAAGEHKPPIWINLEYLSAEPFVEGCHGLPSPLLHGPAAGLTRHFFYPGFTARTGGLLHEPELEMRQRQFDRPAWLREQRIAFSDERLISLFCYEPAALGELLRQLIQGQQPTLLLVTAGRAQAAVRSWLAQVGMDDSESPRAGSLRVQWLPYLTQGEYDHLLWACDLNCVRGEDSLVRAIWAGKPLLWNIYPQHDDAHHGKLEAFLRLLQAPPTLSQLHRSWNDMVALPLPTLDLVAWAPAVEHLRQGLLLQHDLVQQLLKFVAKKR